MYIKPKTMTWGASPDPDVVGYVVRWAIPPATIDYNPAVDPGMNIGNITTIPLPMMGMPVIDGQLTIGVTAVDDAGNESDPAEGTFPFDFQPPGAPTNLVVG